jgi:uncharacterized transporter YbjL
VNFYPVPGALSRRLNNLAILAVIGTFTGIAFFVVLLAVTDASPAVTAGAVIAIVISAVSVAVMLAVVALRLALMLGAWRGRYTDDAELDREAHRFNREQ